LNPKVFIEYSINKRVIGSIIIKLYKDKVPKTVNNFIELIKSKYKGTSMHRIIPGFMIQGGDYERGNGTGGSSIYGKYFEDENFIYKHDKPGLLSMANSGPNTNGSQFFITLDAQPHLDHKHVVFGEVIKNIDLLYEIEKYGTEDGTPRTNIMISDCGLLRE
jgi:cyclophilin family peptidyl-prolyl cis-trans isomerase